MICPNCDRPFTSRDGFHTSDPRGAKRIERYHCDRCGREETKIWEFGKLVKDDITHHGKKL